MSEHTLLALSPLDGRYAGVIRLHDPLRGGAHAGHGVVEIVDRPRRITRRVLDRTADDAVRRGARAIACNPAGENLEGTGRIAPPLRTDAHLLGEVIDGRVNPLRQKTRSRKAPRTSRLTVLSNPASRQSP